MTAEREAGSPNKSSAYALRVAVNLLPMHKCHSESSAYV